MTVWRYTAVGMQRAAGTDRRARRIGELAGECAADVRAALRRIGLQVIDLRPVRSSRTGRSNHAGSLSWWHEARRSLLGSAHRYFRGRRRHQRAELYDSLATMLSSGLPLLEAVDTLIGTTTRSTRFMGHFRGSALRFMLVNIREQLRSGSSLAQAMSEHPSWFEGSEIAMVQAGQHSGTLPEVLRSVAQRHERSGELSHKLISALAYPSIVAMVGLGVVVFLSTKTLPDLTQVLADADIETPALTAQVMAFGQFLAGYWLAIVLVLFGLIAMVVVAAGAAARWGVELPRWLRRLSPKVLRRMAVARLSLQLAQLLRSGVPMVEALRVLAPTTSGGGALGSSLDRRLLAAADHVERGEELSAALDDEHWFDPEFRRLLEIGQASGELDVLLERIGHRYARQANRLIDRLATLLEPCVILALAMLVGMVVMAAVLPLLRMQEVL
ncbi:MAG: type II secretion system F family protein [Planctomycetes bacterium]|nr:type II secretion system F family protein [Planctomycetota bacterium]